MTPGMNSIERRTMRDVHIELVRDLDLQYIAPYLYHKNIITRNDDPIINANGHAPQLVCHQFLVHLPDKCSFSDFIAALRFENVYTFLAEKLERRFLEILQQSDTDSPAEETNCENEKAPLWTDSMTKPVQRTGISPDHRRKLVALSHKLKVLSHNGDMENFHKLRSSIESKFEQVKVLNDYHIEDRMLLADMMFVTLDEEAGARRVRHDVTSAGSSTLTRMQDLIPFTNNPTVSSMTFLARQGSAIAMTGNRDEGFAFVQYAKQHAQNVSPCKETGLVYYIEVNHLTQKYEDRPDGKLKNNIVLAAETAIAQFEGEEEPVKKDYERMLRLKIAFCYLGLGIYCRPISGVVVSDKDVEKAKACLDFVERPSNWQGMEKRRKMFFQVARSETYRRCGQQDLARVHASFARDIAREGGFVKELNNIELTLKEIEECTRSPSGGNAIEETDVERFLIEQLGF